MKRRTLAALPLALGMSRYASAGAQLEEPLADAVRSTLALDVAQAAPPQAPPMPAAAQQSYAQWLAQVDKALARQPGAAPRFSAAPNGGTATAEAAHTRAEFAQTLWYESTRAALEPALVLGLVAHESGFRKYAISHAGAMGYMQVMPFWSRLIGDGVTQRLFHTQTNLRFGCVILRHYLALEGGDLPLALGRYNGSRGLMAYPQAVLRARQMWLFHS